MSLPIQPLARHVCAAIAALLLAATPAFAATLTWTGLGGDGLVSNAANWNPAQAPVAGDTLILAGGTGLAPQLATALTVGSITFNSSAGAFTLGGLGTYTVNGGGITNSSANTETINNAIALGAAQTWNASSGNLVFGGNINNGGFLLTISGGKNNTINGIISGTGGLTKSDTGILTLNGANTYSGTTTLSASGGTIAIGNDTAFGTSAVTMSSVKIQTAGGARTVGNAFTVTRNPTFLNADDLTFSGTVTMSGSRTFTFSGAGVVTFGGVVSQVSGNRKLTKSGTGTLVLNAANTFGGGLTLSAGTVILGNNSAAGTGTLSLGSATVQAGTAARTLTNAVTLAGNTTFSGANDLTFTGATTVSATRTLTVSNSATTFSGLISGAGGLTKSGSGTLTLSGASANTFSGIVTVNDGTLVFNKTAGVNVMAGTVLTIGDAAGAANSATLQLSAANQIPNTAGVTVNADGQLSLQGFTDTIGTLTMNGGSVTGTGASRLDLGGDVTVSATGTNAAQITANVGLNAARTFTVNDNAVSTDSDLAISGIISTAFALTKAGAGTLALSGANTFSGGTNVNAGTLFLDNAAALGTGAVNVGDTTGTSGATLLFSATGGRTVTNAITVRAGSSGTATLGGMNTGGANIFGGNITLNKSVTLTAAAGGEVAFNGVISGALFGLTKIGAGTVRLGGANTYTGLTTISTGTLAYGASNVIATGGVTIDGATAVLDLGASRTDTVGQVILDNGGTITGSGTSALGSTATFDVRNGSVAIPLGGSVALTKSTSGTVVLSAANTYTGATTISAGTLQLGVASSIPSASAVSVSGGATLDLGSLNQTIGSLASAGTAALGAATLTTGGDNTSTTFSGVIGGTGGLTKNGSGVFTLSGTNTFTGATAISAGTLKLGSASGLSSATAVSVAGGATFDLNNFSATVGSLAGAGSVTLGSGTLTSGGNNSSTTFSNVISGSGGLTKSGAGSLTLSGTNTFSGSVLINSGTLALSGAAGRAASASGFTIGTGATLTLDSSAGENADRIGNGAAVTLNGGTLRFLSDGNGSTETVGALNATGGASGIAITHNGAAGDSTSLTFSSLGTISVGATVNFSATGGTLGSTTTGPHIYITGQANGLMGGWATVGSDFAEYYAGGVRAFSSYYTGSDGINVNDATKIVLLTSSSLSSAYTLTNAGTTTDLGLSLSDLATVDLGASSTRTLNLAGGGLIKSSATATTISGAGRLTAGGTANGTLSITVDAGHTLTIASGIIDNAGANGIYGDAGDGVVSLSKADAGLLVLSGASTFGGSVFINAGTVEIGAENNLGMSGNDVIFGGGTLSVTAGFTAGTGKTFTVSSNLSGTLDIASGQTLTLANASDVLTTGNTAAVLSKAGAGEIVIQAANSGFDGTLQIDAGSVELRHAQSLGDSVNRGRITLNGGTLKLRNDTGTNFANDVTLAAASTLDAARLTGTTPAVTHTLGALSIGAQTLTLTGSNGAALTLGAVTLTGGATFNPTTADATLGAVSGAFGFTKTGAGALVLNGASSYTGTATVSTGTLRLGVAGGVPAAAAVSVAGGAVFDLNSLSATIGSLTGAGGVTLGGGTLTTGDGSSTTFSGVISGGGGLTKSGSGIFTLSGANTFTGATTINGGTLQLGIAGGVPSSSALSVSVASGAVFDLNNFSATIGSLVGAGGVALGSGTLTVGGDNSSTTFSGIASGSGGLTKSGSGIFTLSGANTFTGTMNINAGVVVAQNFAAFDGFSGGTVVASGAELRITGGISVGAEPLTLSGTGASGAGALRLISGTVSWAGGITLASAASIGVDAGQLTLGGGISLGANMLTFTGAGATQGDGIIGGSGGLVKNGAGTLTLTAANTFTGATTINVGAVNVRNGAAFGAAGAGAVTLASGATIQFNSAGGISVGNKALTLSGDGIGGAGAIVSILGNHSWAGSMTLASSVTISVVADSLTISGAIGESGGARALTKAGAGKLIFEGDNAYSGATEITAGILELGAAERISDSSAVNVFAGASLSLADFVETFGSLAGAGAVDFGTLITASLTTGGDGTSTIFSGILTGTGDLVKEGGGTMTLSGTNDYTGDTTINGGKLAISSDARLGIGGALFFDGGALQATAGFTTSRAMTLNAGGGTIDTNGSSVTISSAIGGLGGLTKSGAGTLSLTAASTYTGDTTVSAGTLTLGASASILSVNVNVSSGATLSVTSGGTIPASTALTTDGGVIFNSATMTIASLDDATAGLVTLNSTNLSVGSGAFAGVIQNGASAGRLTKTGAGTLTLGGVNTYTGTTTIIDGTLNVIGKIQSSAVTVQMRGTVAGTGTTGSVTVQSGGTIAPGSGGPGILSTGALNLNAGARLAIELGGTAAGTQHDQVSVTGGVTLAGDLQGSLINGFNPAHNDRFFLIINDGADAVSGTFVGFAQGSTLSFGGRDFMVGYTGDSAGGTFTGGNDVVLQAVPEPGTGTMLAGSLVLALGLQRCRRRQRHAK